MALQFYVPDHLPYSGQKMEFDYGNTYVLIGKNACGKTQLLNYLRSDYNFGTDPAKQTSAEFKRAVFLQGNYEQVTEITTINKESTTSQQIGNRNPHQVAGLVASDPILTKIFQYCFKILFDVDLTIEQSQFKTGQYYLSSDADGLKSIFNLLYYLVSPHRIVLLDEPERFLHPSMRSIFLSLLSEIAKNYDKLIIITSHSTESIRFDLDNVETLLLQKETGKIINIKRWIDNITDTRYSGRKDIQAFTDWIYYHTNIFFSKSVCLVEGVSDQIVLEALRNKLSFQLNFENISIEHVASSHHETGGKSRLHKFQSFTKQLFKTFVIADKDVLSGTDLNKWYIPGASETESDKIQNSKTHDLQILSQGEIEDYYFTDPTYGYCITAADAKRNKIPAAYEQARLIYSKTNEEVISQYHEIIEVLKSYSNLATSSQFLKDIAKEYLVDKYVKNSATSEHVTDIVNGADIKIFFKFAGYSKSVNYPTSQLAQLTSLNDAIENSLT